MKTKFDPDLGSPYDFKYAGYTLSTNKTHDRFMDWIFALLFYNQMCRLARQEVTLFCSSLYISFHIVINRTLLSQSFTAYDESSWTVIGTNRQTSFSSLVFVSESLSSCEMQDVWCVNCNWKCSQEIVVIPCHSKSQGWILPKC